MNAKFVLALILTLQVSMSLCEVPTPSQELLDKYNAMKARFAQRVQNTFTRAAASMMEKVGNSDRGQAVKDFVEDLQTKPEFQAVVKVATGLGQEAGPLVDKAQKGAGSLVDKARAALLGVYGHYVRPHVGEHLSSAIDKIKVHLDIIMPAE